LVSDDSGSVSVSSDTTSAPSAASLKKSPSPILSVVGVGKLFLKSATLKLPPMLEKRLVELRLVVTEQRERKSSSRSATASLAPKSATWESLSARSFVEYLKRLGKKEKRHCQ